MGSEGAMEASRTADNGGFEMMRVKTIQFAMVDMMAHPPEGFEEIVRQHFFLKRESILKTLAAWQADARDTASELAVQVADVTLALQNLHAAMAPEAAPAALPVAPLAAVAAPPVDGAAVDSSEAVVAASVAVAETLAVAEATLVVPAPVEEGMAVGAKASAAAVVEAADALPMPPTLLRSLSG
jgi:hypothetical protein